MKDVYITEGSHLNFEYRPGPRVDVDPDRRPPEGLRIGRRVRVVGGCDDTFDAEYIGVEATIVDRVTDDVGATEEDPMWVVWISGQSKEGFWGEELEVV